MSNTNEASNAVYQRMFNWALTVNAQNHFNDFKRRVEQGAVRNDGTDTLLREIDKYVLSSSNSPFQKTIEEGTILYRARIISPDEIYKPSAIRVHKEGDRFITQGYDESDSRECPLGKGAAGRNNIAGVSYLYVSNTPETACSEVKPTLHSLVSVARFIVKKRIRIIDFANDQAFDPTDSINDNLALGPFFTLVMRQYFEPALNDENYRTIQYKATQVITDHIRKSGIDGISYRSSFQTSGVNYTIFNSNRESFEYGCSTVYLLQSIQQFFCDINNQCVLKTQSYGETEYSKKETDDILGNIYKAQTPPPTWDEINNSM